MWRGRAGAGRVWQGRAAGRVNLRGKGGGQDARGLAGCLQKTARRREKSGERKQGWDRQKVPWDRKTGYSE